MGPTGMLGAGHGGMVIPSPFRCLWGGHNVSGVPSTWSTKGRERSDTINVKSKGYEIVKYLKQKNTLRDGYMVLNMVTRLARYIYLKLNCHKTVKYLTKNLGYEIGYEMSQN